MSVQAVELLQIETRRRAPQTGEIEQFNRFRRWNDLVIAMAPAQSKQIIAHGLWEIAHVPIGLDRQRTMTFGEAYRDMGYLPEAMRNYLLRLGDSPCPDRPRPPTHHDVWRVWRRRRRE